MVSSALTAPLSAAPQATAIAPQPKKSPSAAAAATEPRGAGTAGTGDPDRFCSICEASFNNPLMAQQHYAGKKHKKQLTKQKLMETYGPSTSPGQAGCARHGKLQEGLDYDKNATTTTTTTTQAQ